MVERIIPESETRGVQTWIELPYALPPKAWQKIGKRMELIRRYAERKGYATLRGFHWFMKREELTYYDILEEESP